MLDDLNEVYFNAIQALPIDDYDDAAALVRWGVKSINSLPEPPPVEWLIDGLWPRGSYGMWGAPEKSGKSYLTLYGAMCVASGTPFLGRSVRQGVVTLFSGEGATSLAVRRAQKIARGTGIDLSSLDTLLITDHIGKTNDEAFLDVFESACASSVLVIVDPWYVFNGASATESAGNVYSQGGELTKLSARAGRHGTSLWLPHHFRKVKEAEVSLADLTQAGGREWVDSWALITANFNNGVANLKISGGSRQSDDVSWPENVVMDLREDRAVFSVETTTETSVRRVTSAIERNSNMYADFGERILTALRLQDGQRASELRSNTGIATRWNLAEIIERSGIPAVWETSGNSTVYRLAE